MTHYITEEQFNQIKRAKEQFDLCSERLLNICSLESPDIHYGFMMGQTYAQMRDMFIEMMDLQFEIEKQKIDK